MLALLAPRAEGFVAYAIESYTTGYIIRTVDSGRSWEIVQTTNDYLEGIGFRAMDHVMAVGRQGAMWESGIENKKFYCDPYDSPDCRTPWTTPFKNFSKLNSTMRVTEHDLNKVKWFNNNKGVVVGRLGKVYLTTNKGKAWIVRPSDTIIDVNDVGLDEKTGHALVVGTKGFAMRSWDFGGHFDPIPSLESKYFNFFGAACNKNGTHMVAVGARGVIQVSVDDGRTWRAAVYNMTTDTRMIDLELLDVEFFDENRGIIVGNMCLILKTVDGGLNWFRVKIKCNRKLAKNGRDYEDDPQLTLYDASVDRSGWGIIAARNHFYITRDFGATWQQSEELFHLDINHVTSVAMMAAGVFEPVYRDDYDNDTQTITQVSYTDRSTTDVTLEFTNIGSMPFSLMFINVTSYCQCVEVNMDQTTPYGQLIPPGQKGKVTVTYGTGDKGPGTYFSRVNIYHSGPTKAFRLDINLKLQHEIFYLTLSFVQRYWLLIMLTVLLILVILYFRTKTFIKWRKRIETNRFKLRAYRKVVRKELCPHFCIVYGCDLCGYLTNSRQKWVYTTSYKRALDMDTDSDRERSSDEEDVSSVSSVSSDMDLESIDHDQKALPDITSSDTFTDESSSILVGEAKRRVPKMKTMTSDDSSSDSSSETGFTSGPAPANKNKSRGTAASNGVYITSSDSESSSDI